MPTPKHESTADFKARLAAMLRDPREPERVTGAKPAHPSLVRRPEHPGYYPARPPAKRPR